MTTEASSAPLELVRVVDFTHILAGPYCTQLLADAGADIIKVEPPGGEFSRVRGPVRVGPDGTEVSSYNAAINRGKRSIVVDLKNRHGLDLAKRLVAGADVVVENFAPGALRKLGLDLGDLRARNPRLITVSITLFGSEETAGPLASRAGLAIVAEGESSFLAMTRDPAGKPVNLRVPLGDMATGLSAYAGIVTALYERERSGMGCHLDVSMVRTLLSLNSLGVANAQFRIRSDAPPDSPAGYGIFPSNDGYVVIGVNSDGLFRRLAVMMGMPELADDPRYRSHVDRDLRVPEVNEIVAGWTAQVDSDTLVELAARAEVPCGKVNTPEDLLEDPELRARGFLESVADGLGGTIDTAVNPVGHRRPGSGIPRLAAHAREILAELGVDDDEFARLEELGALGPRERSQ